MQSLFLSRQLFAHLHSGAHRRHSGAEQRLLWKNTGIQALKQQQWLLLQRLLPLSVLLYARGSIWAPRSPT